MLLTTVSRHASKQVAAFVFFTVAMILWSIHFLCFENEEGGHEQKENLGYFGHRTKQYDWDEVKE